MTFCTDKNGSQRMHTNDVSDPLSLTLKPPLGLFYLFNYFFWSVFTEWITVICDTDINGSQKRTPNDFCDPLTLPLVPPADHSLLSSEMFQHLLMD